MLVINAKENLEYRDLVNFFRKLQDDTILVTFENNPKDVELLLQKDEIVYKLFNRKYTRELLNKDIIVTLFNEDVLLETTIDEIHKISTPARVKKFLELTGVEVEETKEDKDIPKIITKTIAIGYQLENEVEDIETLTVTPKETKKAIEFLNERISRYYIHNLQEYIRICLDYDVDELEWLTIEDLFERGLAS